MPFPLDLHVCISCPVCEHFHAQVCFQYHSVRPCFSSPTSSDTHRQEVGMDVRWTDHSPYIRERERERHRKTEELSPLTPSAFSPASTHPVFLSSVFLIHAGKEHLQESMRSWERAVSHYKNIAFHTSCLYAVKLQQDLIRLSCCSAPSSIKLIIVSSSN